MANKKHLATFDRTTVKTPCDAAWEEMTGSDEVRFCRHCAKNVHNISAMTRKEAKKLVAASNGKTCIRYARKPDGKIQTQPTRFHQITRQTGIAAGILVTSLSVSSVVYAQGRAVKAKPQTSIQQTSTNNSKTNNLSSQISFTISDITGAIIANAKVTLINQTTKKEYVINTNDEGVARFDIIPFGRYEIRAHSEYFEDFTRIIR
ncbi:MAG: carboxypeptidase regulatory-like domain-containing protein, partial [Pyrinomonadaceae bacterium]|nr:carboxypeptidase regulatory-like domain-containing protein [Pyrinomonadaceae bacterium]